MDRKMNNAIWIIDEFSEWLDKSILAISELKNKSIKTEYGRLSEKESTLRMVKKKLEQLKYE